MHLLLLYSCISAALRSALLSLLCVHSAAALPASLYMLLCTMYSAKSFSSTTTNEVTPYLCTQQNIGGPPPILDIHHIILLTPQYISCRRNPITKFKYWNACSSCLRKFYGLLHWILLGFPFYGSFVDRKPYSRMVDGQKDEPGYLIRCQWPWQRKLV